MRVVLPNGKVVETYKVEPWVETSVNLNDKKQNMTSVAKDLSVRPTGIHMYILNPASLTFTTAFVGNLAAEKVIEILDTFGATGFYNFSKLEYQKTAGNDVVIDGGCSLPYFRDNAVSVDYFD